MGRKPFPRKKPDPDPCKTLAERRQSLKRGHHPSVPKGLFFREEWKILDVEMEKEERKRFCVGAHGRKAAAKGFRHSHQ